jgi:hypothetical protein
MSSLKNLFRLSIGAGVVLVIAAVFVSHAATPSATTKSTAPTRGYYLTTGSFDGSQVLTACTSGYHTADIFEIHETSVLSYNTTLGQAQIDAGTGPPVGVGGWARTSGGGHSCNLWTSNNSTDVGMAFELDPVYADPPTVLAPWLVDDRLACNMQLPVWCIQN